MNYDDGLTWLYQTQLYGIKMGLDPTRRLMQEMDAWPREGQRVIHVAGTNGKGSVCAFLDSIFRVNGYRTGLFTSPHLICFTERVRVSGENIPKERVASLLTELRKRVSTWDPHPTFFELTTVLAFRYFREQECEVIVLETGMGGRLDSTNVLPAPQVTAITRIELDHQKFLGDTIAQIAGEKAGIIKKGRPVVTYPQYPEAERVIQARARELEAVCYCVDEPLPESDGVGLKGSHQRLNAAMAVRAAELSGLPLRPEATARGIAGARFPGRFHAFDERIILDGAHNPSAVERLVQTWTEEFGSGEHERPLIIFGSLQDKECRQMLRLLAPLGTWFLPAVVNNPRTLSRNEVARLLREAASGRVTPMSRDLRTVLDQLRGKDGDDAGWATGLRRLGVALPEKEMPGRVLVTGSFFLVGEALAILQGDGELPRLTAQ